MEHTIQHLRSQADRLVEELKEIPELRREVITFFTESAGKNARCGLRGSPERDRENDRACVSGQGQGTQSCRTRWRSRQDSASGR